MSIELDALIDISNLLGGPVGAYYSPELKVKVYEARVERASKIARRVIIIMSAAASIPLPPSSFLAE
jgi:hypothetical protein